MPSPDNAFLKRQGLSGHEEVSDLGNLLGLLSTILQSLLYIVWLRQVGVDVLSWVDKERVEFLTRPLDQICGENASVPSNQVTNLDRVLDGIREVLDGAGRSLFLRRILRRAIGFG